MSFSKILYVILTILFLIVFSSYLIIDIKSNKVHLETQTTIEVQNTIAVLEIINTSYKR